METASAHTKSLTDSIPFSQTLWLKKTCTETLNLFKHLCELKESFINPRYKERFLTDQFNQISEVTREASLSLKQKIANKSRIPPVVKLNRTPTSILKIIDKHWNLLKINPKLKHSFQERLVLVCKKKRNLIEITGSNKILNKDKNNNNKKEIQKKKTEKKDL